MKYFCSKSFECEKFKEGPYPDNICWRTKYNHEGYCLYRHRYFVFYISEFEFKMAKSIRRINE